MTDEEGYKFLMSEYILPAKNEDFIEVFGFDFDTWKKAFKSKKADFMKMPKDNVKQWKAIFAYAHLDISMKTKK